MTAQAAVGVVSVTTTISNDFFSPRRMAEKLNEKIADLHCEQPTV